MVKLGSIASIVRLYHDGIREDLKGLLPQLGTNIIFEEDFWWLDKHYRPGYDKSEYIWSFNSIPHKYREIVKYYTLADDRLQPTTMVRRIGYLGTFLNYLADQYNDIDLSTVDRKVLNDFKLWLNNREGAKSWKQQIWSSTYRFFATMKGWTEMPHRVPLTNRNPWSRNFKDCNINDKYIPDYVTDQLDKLFLRDDIPDFHRLFYWLLRLIPSRVSEITSMEINCLKPYTEGKWVIIVPQFKQNGGHIQRENRLIYVWDEGIISVVLELLRKQQEKALELQSQVHVEQQGLLFLGYEYRFDYHYFKKTGTERYVTTRVIRNYTPENATYFLSTYCKRYNIKDENGRIYNVSSHQFRHNGITDRFEEGFTTIEIRDMTGHKNGQMPEIAYFHPSKEWVTRTAQKISLEPGETLSELPLVVFKGRIRNLDPYTEEQILKQPRAYSLGRLGICGDITGCKNNIFEHLACNQFIPDADDIDYWNDRVDYWQKEVQKNQGPVRENAEYNLALHKSVIRRIEIAVSEMEVETSVKQAGK